MEKWPWYLKFLFIVIDVFMVGGIIFISCKPGVITLKPEPKRDIIVRAAVKVDNTLCNDKAPWAVTVFNDSPQRTVNKVYIKSEAYEEGSSKNLFNNDSNAFGLITWRYIVKPRAAVTKCFALEVPSSATIKIIGVEASFYEPGTQMYFALVVQRIGYETSNFAGVGSIPTEGTNKL